MEVYKGFRILASPVNGSSMKICIQSVTIKGDNLSGKYLVIISGTCKFGQDCAFVHKTSDTIQQPKETENNVQELTSEIELMKSNLIQGETKLLKSLLEDLGKTVSSNIKLIEALHEKINTSSLILLLVNYVITNLALPLY